MIDIGKVQSLENDDKGLPEKARVLPNTAPGAVTMPLTVPYYLRWDIKIDSEVFFLVTESMEGMILGLKDGNWSGKIKEDVAIAGSLSVDENATVKKAAEIGGDLDVKQGATIGTDAGIGGLSFKNHVHNCTGPGNPSGIAIAPPPKP